MTTTYVQVVHLYTFMQYEWGNAAEAKKMDKASLVHMTRPGGGGGGGQRWALTGGNIFPLCEILVITCSSYDKKETNKFGQGGIYRDFNTL
jgi:hypothetical protein